MNGQEKSAEWFKHLRDQICAEFEKIEQEFAETENVKAGKFERTPWTRAEGGGGEISALRNGAVFEKVAVNISTVFGHFSEEFAKKIPGALENSGKFWASGISLIAHMNSPLVPAVHMNTRQIVTSKSWFGGGADLTPMFENSSDTEFFHSKLKEACDKTNKSYYPEFKDHADRYFFLNHRKEPRGVGGIFFDNLNSGDFENDFSFTKDVGLAFLEAFPPLVRKHMHEKWTAEEREFQLKKRGRYVEFNLLQDRGTIFGLMTGGNIEAILMSLPPIVKW